MRLVVRAFVAWLVTGPVVGCAKVPLPEGPPIVSVGCTNDRTSSDVVSILDWELDVSPEPIESGQPFSATLGGTAVFPEEFLDAAQPFWPGGVREIDLVALNATVRVRSGATGGGVVLHPEPVPYKCFVDKSACNHANDLPSVPGLVGNTDCEPVNRNNPCGRFYVLPISSDCDPGGACADRGKTGPLSQCELNEFCIIGDQRFPLQEGTGHYTAATDKTEVLFGWDDQSTGATVLRDPNDPNDGTWILPPSVYEEPLGPLGFRVTVFGVRGTMECTMGVDSRGPLGVNSQDELSSPTPDSALIAFPIQTGLP